MSTGDELVENKQVRSRCTSVITICDTRLESTHAHVCPLILRALVIDLGIAPDKEDLLRSSLLSALERVDILVWWQREHGLKGLHQAYSLIYQRLEDTFWTSTHEAWQACNIRFNTLNTNVPSSCTQTVVSLTRQSCQQPGNFSAICGSSCAASLGLLLMPATIVAYKRGCTLIAD